MPEERVGIADAVRAVRSELLTTIAESKDESLHFRMDSVEIELSLAMEHETEAQAGVNPDLSWA
jgi:hypothetical protein